MEKISESHVAPRPAEFDGWKRIANPFFLVSAGSEGSRFHARWGRIFGSALGLALAGYLALAAGAFLFIRHHEDVTAIGYLDFVFPSRWSAVRVARGDHHISVARKLLQKGQPLEALMLLRLGVSRSPANVDGRLLLTQLLMEAGRPELARQILFEGLALHHEDPAYLRPFFSFLFQRQRDVSVIAIAQKYLPAHPADTERNRLYSLAAATAAYFRGDYDTAEDFLRAQPGLAAAREGRLLTAKIEWERGYHELALLALRELAAAQPDDAEVHAELAAHLERDGRADEVRRAALAFQIAHPALPGPRLELLRAYRSAGDTARVARETESFLRDFAGDASALLALADFAANAGEIALARRLADLARAQKFAWEPHAILMVEAMVVARDFSGALDAARDLLHDNADWTGRFGPVLNSLQAIAHFGLGETESASLMLTTYLNQSYLRAENLLAIAQRLAEVDAADYARQTLLRATTADPLNQAALTRLVEFDLNLNRIDELPVHLRRLLTMRKPSPDVLRVAQHKLGSDLFLFSPERPAAMESVRLALDKATRANPRL